MGIKDDRLGLLEWFHIGDYEQAESTLHEMRRLPFTKLRTGFSWADYHSERGKAWYDWLIPLLAKEVELLPCFLYTPPSLGIVPKTSSPLRRTRDYADFLDEVVTRYGKYFDYVELWNEPNNLSDYDFTLDQGWQRFCEMIGSAAFWMKHRKKNTVLGGMAPVDPNWLSLMYSRGVMDYVDVIGVHHFPGVFETHWDGWSSLLQKVENVVNENGGKQPVWISETGYATVHYKEYEQLVRFVECLDVPVDRIYWYGLTDLSKKYPTVDGLLLDDREYAFGMLTAGGNSKLLHRLLTSLPPSQVIQRSRSWQQAALNDARPEPDKYILLIGGAGMIGAHLAAALMKEKQAVLIFDKLLTPEAIGNLEALRNRYGSLLRIVVADTRNRLHLESAVRHASFVFHLPPGNTLTVNPLPGVSDALLLLEEIRCRKPGLPVVYLSSYEVYGTLGGIRLEETETSYKPVRLSDQCILESRPLEPASLPVQTRRAIENYFVSYGATYGMAAAVIRAGEIYGQHLCSAGEAGVPASVFNTSGEGSGEFSDLKHTRDWLAVEDLVHALCLARRFINELSGGIYNVGGGLANRRSYLEIALLSGIDAVDIHPAAISAGQSEAPRYYVSDISSFSRKTGWAPTISVSKGLARPDTLTKEFPEKLLSEYEDALP